MTKPKNALTTYTLIAEVCPAWCTTDHARHRVHTRLVGQAGPLAVYLGEIDGKTFVQIHNLPLVQVPSARTVTEIDSRESLAFAGLLSSLGRPELAAILCEAAELTRTPSLDAEDGAA